MKLRRKLAVSTLAASLVAGTFAGIPLSNKGLAEAMGFSSVAYAATLPSTTAAFQQKLRDLYEKAEELGYITQVDLARSQLTAVNFTSDAAVTELYNYVKSQVPAGHENEYTHLLDRDTFDGLFRLGIGLSLAMDNNVDILKQSMYVKAVNEFGKLGGVQDVQFEDFVEFANAIEADLKSHIDLTVLLKDAEYKQLLKDSLNRVLTADSTKFAKAYNNLAITNKRVNNIVDSIVGKMPGYKDGLKSLLIAAVSLEAKLEFDPTGDVRVRTPFLTFSGLRIGSPILSWTVSPNNLITIDNGQLVFSGEGTATVTLKANFNNQSVYSQQVTLTYRVPASTYSPPPVIDQMVLPDFGETMKALEEIAKKLVGASDTERARLLEEALKIVQQALNKAELDLSKSLRIEGDKAVAQPNQDSAKRLIAELKKAADQLKAKLKDMGANPAGISLPLKLDLGQTSSSAGEVTITKDILVEAQNAGFASVTVVVNGASMIIPISQLSADTTISLRKVTTSPITDKTKVSDIIDFNLSVGGQAVTNFKQPIQIRIPVQTPAGVDKELLTTAKIVDGKLVFVGGHLEGNEMVESRDTLSPYVVVENKVTFKDTASVQAWAGRSIQVLAAKGAIVGKSEGVFAPNDNVTRAEFVKMLISALDLEDGSATENFTDVNDTDWFAPYVAAAVKLGIVHGRSADQFVPQASITRAEMTAMIVHALEVTQNLKNDVTDMNAVLKVFSDASKINSTLKASVALAASKGLVVGYAGKFDPNGKATRAQAAVVLYKILNFKK
ncbi:S-layer homology domain-containing protein [Cohnella pontilimi]|nr:S-layer homology domain-containing protein [Cohnella pontilimi]